jgi:N-acetylmuramoyl-L-alanine amidase
MKVICIDPGHGGKDPGAISLSNKREKDFALDVALRLDKLLNQGGFRSALTRYKDKYIKLAERAQLANLIGADLFISIHFNAAGSKEAQGTEVLHYPSKTSQRFAQLINNEVKGLGRKDRGVKARANLVVLNSTNMTACLVEGGFLTNAAEEKLINSPNFRQQLAAAIFKGIKEYFK